MASEIHCQPNYVPLDTTPVGQPLTLSTLDLNSTADSTSGSGGGEGMNSLQDMNVIQGSDEEHGLWHQTELDLNSDCHYHSYLALGNSLSLCLFIRERRRENDNIPIL